MTDQPTRYAIHRRAEFSTAEHAGWLDDGIRTIFRAAAARWPDTEQAANSFAELWLETYFRNDPQLIFIALKGAGDRAPTPADVTGYLVASLANPATDPRFAAMEFYQDFALHIATYPAHLHINVASDARNTGIGRALIEAAASVLSSTGVPGVHIVTAADARNVRFYRRAGFEICATSVGTGRERVLMGRNLRDEFS